MQRLEVSGAVRPIYGSLGVKRLSIVVGKHERRSSFVRSKRRPEDIIKMYVTNSNGKCGLDSLGSDPKTRN